MKVSIATIKDGLADFRAAHRLVVTHRTWRLIMIPGLLSLLYFPIVIGGTFWLTKALVDLASNNLFPGLENSPVLKWTLVIVLYLVSAVAGLLAFRNVIMVLCSPLLGYMSETVEKEMGRIIPPAFSLRGIAFDTIRGTTLSLITLVIAIVVFLGCWLISLIPLIGSLIAIVVLPVSQAFLAGVGFADPALERRRYSVRDSLRFSWAHRGRLLGHGIGFSLLLLIPFVGWFLAPSYGIIAGTIGAVTTLDPDPTPTTDNATPESETPKPAPNREPQPQ